MSSFLNMRSSAAAPFRSAIDKNVNAPRRVVPFSARQGLGGVGSGRLRRPVIAILDTPLDQEIPAGRVVLDRFTMLGKLTQGGMAEVYLACQKGPAGYSKLVVIKRVRPTLADDKDFVAMFVNEARLAALINHPNVVQIFDLGQDKRDWLLAMEFLDGRDMLQLGRACRAHKKAVPFDVTARIIADACAGLEHAHRLLGADGKPLNLVHRDMSPENILITFEGGVKVVDFGIAKARDNALRTQAGQIKGKLGYVAPEAILGQPLDGRADIFAIGATLYLFLCSRPAFTGQNPMEIFERSLQPPELPSKLNSLVPPMLEEICVRCLERDPDKRYRTAGDLREALEGYLLSTGRPLGPPQLGQFMKILFPADKDPVRQHINALIDAGSAPEPLEVEPDEEDGDATAVVPAKDRPDRQPQWPPPVKLSNDDNTAQVPAYRGAAMASGQGSGSGFLLRSVEVASQLEKNKRAPSRPEAVEVTASTQAYFPSDLDGTGAPADMDDLAVELDDEDDFHALEVTKQTPAVDEERPYAAAPPPLQGNSLASHESNYPLDSLLDEDPAPSLALAAAEDLDLELAHGEASPQDEEGPRELGLDLSPAAPFFVGPAAGFAKGPRDAGWRLPDLAEERERQIVTRPASLGARLGMLALGMGIGAVLLTGGLYALGELEWAQARLVSAAEE
jgi:serine/threonine protein kinase